LSSGGKKRTGRLEGDDNGRRPAKWKFGKEKKKEKEIRKLPKPKIQKQNGKTIKNAAQFHS
jgi:hypothetical protein